MRVLELRIIEVLRVWECLILFGEFWNKFHVRSGLVVDNFPGILKISLFFHREGALPRIVYLI